MCFAQCQPLICRVEEVLLPWGTLHVEPFSALHGEVRDPKLFSTTFKTRLFLQAINSEPSNDGNRIFGTCDKDLQRENRTDLLFG